MEPGGHDAIMAFRVIFIFGQIEGGAGRGESAGAGADARSV